ncbi:MAG: class I SAM-dependent methyltransferase [Fibrobacteria bacterium]
MDKASEKVSETETALVAIGRFLEASGYAFTAITPASHALVNARVRMENGGKARSLRDIFGWSLPFSADALPSHLLAWLEKSGELEKLENAGGFASGLGRLRSKIRFSTLKGCLYVHSAFPTVEADSVFFGPDTYRFADLIDRVLSDHIGRLGHPGGPVRRVLDIGCGSGAGGLFLAGNRLCQTARVFLSDINFRALRYARVNALLGRKGNVSVLLGDTVRAFKGQMDLIVSNPPYLVDAEARLYRDGGGASGCDLSIRIVRESIPLLAPAGQLILYTGTPVMEGRHVFREAVAPILDASGLAYEYAEIDPDVFGEELAHPAYASTERLAAVSLVLRR